MNKKIFKIALYLFLIGVFTLNIISCADDDKPINPDENVVLPDDKPLTPQLSTGFFVVNEDWFGHDNGTVNFFKNDGSVIYRAYRAANPGKHFGVTTQFATVYGDNIYFISKQGERLVIADAKTLKLKKEIRDIGGNDGRSFLGITPEKGYLATGGDVRIVSLTDFTVGNALPEIKGEAGDMCLVGNRAFILVNYTQCYVINTKDDTIEKLIIEEGKKILSGIVQTKDGNLWIGAGENLIQVNPYTLQVKKIDVKEAPIPYPMWAWQSGNLCAGAKENTLYWTSGNQVVKYDIESKKLTPSFYTLDNKLSFFGTGIGIDPLTGKIILTTTEGYKTFWIHILNSNSTLDKEFEYKGEKITGAGKYNDSNPYYWFPAMPFFEDVNAPQILINQVIVKPNSRTAISLNDKIVDADNLSSSIVKTIEASKSNLITCEVKMDSLIIKSGKEYGKTMVKLRANSNGKTTEKEIRIDIR